MKIDVRNKGRGVRGVNITKMMIFRGDKILEEKKVFSLIVFFFFQVHLFVFLLAMFPYVL